MFLILFLLKFELFSNFKNKCYFFVLITFRPDLNLKKRPLLFNNNIFFFLEKNQLQILIIFTNEMEKKLFKLYKYKN